ncbi:glyoxylase-like metal-dependent hydrolase (beta-lactamase superfamily II) [Streptomyces sp. SAI-041]|nr:glyoxylase-like metal-dependent hydrolase (beta-lactamase superfamily II) [Streptomyces sp. SAI-041]
MAPSTSGATPARHPRAQPPVRANTRKNPEAFASLIHDVETKIFDVLPDETWVYPGHGNDTTLGAERPQLPEWRARGW